VSTIQCPCLGLLKSVQMPCVFWLIGTQFGNQLHTCIRTVFNPFCLGQRPGVSSSAQKETPTTTLLKDVFLCPLVSLKQHVAQSEPQSMPVVCGMPRAPPHAPLTRLCAARIWSLRSRACKAVISDAHSEPVVCVALSPKGDCVASSASDHTIRCACTT